MSRNRIIIAITFVTGIFLGFLFGGALVYHQYESLIKGKEINSRIDRLIQQTEKILYLNQKDDTVASTSTKTAINSPRRTNIADSLLENDEHLNELIQNLNQNPNDSSYLDSTLKIIPEGQDEPIIIKKDLLLESRKVNIIGIDLKKAKKNQYLDSLLTDDPNSKADNGSITIEFWESPLNYKGYKMNKNKIVLFGLAPSSNVLIKKIDNSIYLEYDKRFYALTMTNEYLSYHMITNDVLIKQLRQ